MQENETQKTRKKTIAIKVVNIVSTVLVALLFVLGVVMLIYTTSARADGVPSIFGKSSLNIVSDSMTGEINVGDLIFIERTNTAEQKSSLKVGDIITFKSIDENGKSYLNTHKIIDVLEPQEVCEEFGNPSAFIRYVTAGVKPGLYDDAADGLYQNCQHETRHDLKTVGADDIVGKYTGKIAGLGGVITFLQSKWGFFFIVMCPLILYFAWRLYVLIRLLVKTGKEKKKEDLDKDSKLLALQKEIMALKNATEVSANESDLIDESKTEDDSDNDSKTD